MSDTIGSSRLIHLSTKGYFFKDTTVCRSLALYKKGGQEDKLQEPHFMRQLRQEPCLLR